MTPNGARRENLHPIASSVLSAFSEVDALPPTHKLGAAPLSPDHRLDRNVPTKELPYGCTTNKFREAPARPK
jgi:hypothetical protein